ncbi:MAG: glycosyltransferase family 9 protein [Chthoniobacteraceae bacterium]
MGRILVIRGGAIGDFILTLPVLRLLRENFPDAHLEILGYRHIVALAENRFYAQATRSIEYGRLSPFFIPNAELDAELVEYFAGFHQVISYLFDPDHFFENNLRRAGVKNLITGSPKIGDASHATYQLAAPLESMALFLDDPAAQLFPSAQDVAGVSQQFQFSGRPLIAIHPGSGGERKCWPVESWSTLVRQLHAAHPQAEFMVIIGEADEARFAAMAGAMAGVRHQVLRHLPLPLLAAALSQGALFIGHDSGISHIAAAVGTPCLLLFGPTDPEVWAPKNSAVRVLSAPDGLLFQLPPEQVFETAQAMLSSGSGGQI